MHGRRQIIEELMMTQGRVIIVGGGICGALVAIHLLRSGRPLSITLFERNRDIGRGIAYSAPGAEILLNVPAARMSPLPDEPELFFNWASAHPGHRLLQGRTVTPQSFLPRELYGDFISELLSKATQESEHGSIEMVQTEVQQITHANDRWMVSGAFGTEESNHVVLALGNPPPTLPPSLSKLPQELIINPWQSLAFNVNSLGSEVLCIGSGLTAVDVAVKLRSLGYHGKIQFISRHGFLPLSHHQDPLKVAATKLEPVLGSLTGLVRAIRTQLSAASARGEPWQIVLDTLRPSHQAIWRSLSLKEQQRFIRHLSSYWEIHRHRVAPELHALLQNLLSTGRLTMHAGNVVKAEGETDGVSLTVRKRGTQHLHTLTGSHLFLCTGPARTLGAWQNPLIDRLLADTFLEQDKLGIGFRPTTAGDSKNLHVLGTALRGTLWESTAMRELAIQAKDISRRILNG